MAVTCLGITMYDIRTTWKGVAAEAITMGMSVYLSTADGRIHFVDGTNSVCHGWALTSVLLGETLTIVTACRMNTDAAEVVGQRVRVGNAGAGSAPSSTLVAGVYCGFALDADSLWLSIESPPPAEAA